MKRILLLLTLIVPFELAAQTLTPSEQAAQDERAPTTKEREAHKTGCEFSDTPVSSPKKLRLTEYVSAPVVSLSQIELLTFLYVTLDDPAENKFAINRTPDLPNGGIASFDFCGVVSAHMIDKPNHKGGLSRLAALRLRDGLNLDKDYPNTSKAIRKLNMLQIIPEGWYVKVEDSGSFKAQEWMEENASYVRFRRPGLPYFRIDGAVYLPIRSHALSEYIEE